MNSFPISPACTDIIFPPLPPVVIVFYISSEYPSGLSSLYQYTPSLPSLPSVVILTYISNEQPSGLSSL